MGSLQNLGAWVAQRQLAPLVPGEPEHLSHLHTTSHVYVSPTLWTQSALISCEVIWQMTHIACACSSQCDRG